MTRQYVWYSAEINVITFQIIMSDCHVSFEWDYHDMVEHLNYPDIGWDHYHWIPLGEL